MPTEAQYNQQSSFGGTSENPLCVMCKKTTEQNRNGSEKRLVDGARV